MSVTPLEIVCVACGADALLRREPVYDGFTRVGERLFCSACGHEYADEAAVPFKRASAGPAVFTEADRPRPVRVFRADEAHRSCRHCIHYIVNPFTQRCGLHGRPVEATDVCERLEPRAEEAAD